VGSAKGKGGEVDKLFSLPVSLRVGLLLRSPHLQQQEVVEYVEKTVA